MTDLGRALFEQTDRLFRLQGEIEQLLSTAHGLVSGELRVGADAPYHIIPLLANYNRRYPGVRLSLSFGNSETLLKALFDQRYDVAVLPNIRSDPRLQTPRLRPDRLVVFVARGDAWSSRRSIRLEELGERRVIMREAGSTTRSIFEAAASQAGVRFGEVMEIGSREGVREAVAAGLGVGVVSETEQGNDSRLHFLSVRNAKLENVEYLACLRERHQSAAVKAFFGLLTENPNS